MANVPARHTLFTLTALLSTAACSQSSTVLKAAPTPTPIIACPGALLEAPRLIYPSPGATSVPTNIGEIIVDKPADGGSFALVAPSSSPLAIGPIESVPSPAPTTLPTSEPASSFVAVPVPTLSPETTYSVVFEAPTDSGPCGPIQPSGTIGSFGT